MPKELPPAETLRQLLDYDPGTGILTWKTRPREMFANNDLRICNTWNTRYAGKEALGHIDANGYKTGSMERIYAKAHRVIWKITYGADPLKEIDHINGDRADNRLSNLREVSQSENQRNAGLRRDNKSGHAGIFISRNQKITAHACGKYIGTYPSIDAALTARIAKEQDLGFTGAARQRKGRPKPPKSVNL